jgi:ribosomal protein S18 acetylase RimI-like enzyme
MRISFRPARPEDFDYCASLYFAGMGRTIRELSLDMAAHVANFRQRWEVPQVRIIMLDGADVGWLQSTTQADALFLAQLFVDGSFQRQGIGAEVMKQIINEAARADQAVTLGVVKTNPALRLYQRLGFHITHEDDRKFYMRREPDAAA